MNAQHKEIRALLSSMAPNRAEEAVKLVGLPPDEEAAIIFVDIRKRSCLQAADELRVSVDGFNKLRRKAYQKMTDDMRG